MAHGGPKLGPIMGPGPAWAHHNVANGPFLTLQCLERPVLNIPTLSTARSKLQNVAGKSPANVFASKRPTKLKTPINPTNLQRFHDAFLIFKKTYQMYSTTFAGKSPANVFALKTTTKLNIPINTIKFTAKVMDCWQRF